MASSTENFPFVIRGEFTPHIAKSIFGLLDKQTMAKSRQVSKTWRRFVDDHTRLWRDVTQLQFVKAAGNGRHDICKLIIGQAENKNPANSWGWTPFHQAAVQGCIDICRLIMHNVIGDKNPPDKHGATPLHWAVKNGHLDICQMIIANVDNKNPGDKEARHPCTKQLERVT